MAKKPPYEELEQRAEELENGLVSGELSNKPSGKRQKQKAAFRSVFAGQETELQFSVSASDGGVVK